MVGAVLCLLSGEQQAVAQQNPYPPQYQYKGPQTTTAPAGRELTPDWTLTLPGPVSSAAFSADGSCLAVVSHEPRPGRIVLIDRSGQRAWDFAPPQVLAGDALAVAPNCAWVAFDATRDGRLPPAGRREASPYSGGGGRDTNPAAAYPGADRRGDLPGQGRGGPRIDGAVGIRRRDGTSFVVSVEGLPSSIAINHAGDLLAVGTEGRGNLFIATPDGRVVRALERFTGRAPQVVFSADDKFIVVTGWYGVGVITSAGERVWGPWPLTGSDAKRTDWRRIDPSRDLQWFAAQQGPMYGPDGGSFALLSSSGEVAWRGPDVWDPQAKIAPDGSYFVVLGRERARGRDIDDGAPGRLSIMDRSGRILVSKDLPRPTLECVSLDGRWILMREVDQAARTWLVGRDKTLAPSWRVGQAERYAVSVESGLIVGWIGGRISGYWIPR